jgi:hypothetical protein
MMEYIFFDAGLRDSFVVYAQGIGVDCALQDDSMGLVVAVPEDLDDEVMDALEARYDELQQDRSRLELSEGGLKRLAGFRFDLPDGRSCMVPVQTELANRLLASFSLEEIQALFGAVARRALNPDEDRLCQMVRDAQADA